MTLASTFNGVCAEDCDASSALGSQVVLHQIHAVVQSIGVEVLANHRSPSMRGEPVVLQVHVPVEGVTLHHHIMKSDF